jgi:hypothetical protein
MHAADARREGLVSHELAVIVTAGVFGWAVVKVDKGFGWCRRGRGVAAPVVEIK